MKKTKNINFYMFSEKVKISKGKKFNLQNFDSSHVIDTGTQEQQTIFIYRELFIHT